MKEKLYQIDNILMRLEDYIHGKDGDDITTARRNLIEFLRSIEKAEEQAKVFSSNAVLADSLPPTCIDGFSDDKFCDRTNGCKWCRRKR